jgi:RimJ/RimL family protein N-acetyltransferase
MQGAEFAFPETRLERLDIVIHPQNLPSRRVAEAIGARDDGGRVGGATRNPPATPPCTRARAR